MAQNGMGIAQGWYQLLLLDLVRTLIETIIQDLRPQDSIPFLRRVSADLQRADVTRPYSNQAHGKESPDIENIPLPDQLSNSPTHRVSNDQRIPFAAPTDAEGTNASGQHTFVKTSFSKGES